MAACLDRKEAVESVILYIGFFSLGLALAVPGPTLLDLAALTGSDTRTVSTIFMGRALCGLAGSIVAGFLVTRIHRWLPLGVALGAVAVTTVATPHTRHVSWMVVMFGIKGLAAGYYNAAGNMVLLQIWGEKNGPWMQALHCVFGLGALTGPLVAEPFLSTSPDSIDVTNVSISSRQWNTVTDAGYDVISDVTSSPMNTSGVVTNLYQTGTNIVWCYLIVAIVCLVAALLTIVPVLCLSKSPESEPLCPKSDKEEIKEEAEGAPQSDARSEKIFRGAIVILVFLFYVTYCILEINYGIYLTAYAVKYLGWTKSTGAIVTSAYWATFTAGRAAGIVLARYVSAPIILATDICVCVVALLPLMICPRAHTAVLWASSITLGFGTSTVFASGITWTERYLKVSSGIVAIFMVAAALGELLGPLLIGIFFDKLAPQGFIYVMFSAACLLLVLFTIMQITAARHGRRPIGTPRQFP